MECIDKVFSMSLLWLSIKHNEAQVLISIVVLLGVLLKVGARLEGSRFSLSLSSSRSLSLSVSLFL